MNFRKTAADKEIEDAAAKTASSSQNLTL